MTRKPISILISAAVAAAGLGAGLAAAVSSGPSAPPKTTAAAAVSAAPPYSYYRSMMSRYYSRTPATMTGGSGGSGSMMSPAGYQWMFGSATPPAWMRGAQPPATITGTGTDMGQIMGRLWADAPGPRVSTQQAARDANQIPAGAQINRAANTITFTSSIVSLTAVASPAGGPDETFRIAALANPTIIVAAGSQLSIQVINADPDTAHGLAITTTSNPSSPMPMMTAPPAFTGSALWFLANPTTAGMHTATMTFTASIAGTYHYLCPVPGHAQQGMTGQLIIASPR